MRIGHYEAWREGRLVRQFARMRELRKDRRANRAEILESYAGLDRALKELPPGTKTYWCMEQYAQRWMAHDCEEVAS